MSGDKTSFGHVFARGIVFGVGIFIGFAMLYGLVLGGVSAVDTYDEQCSPDHTLEVHYSDGNTSEPMVYTVGDSTWEQPWYCLGESDEYEEWNGTIGDSE